MTRVVIVGGSLGAAKTAQGLRERGFDGDIVVLTEEHVLPYDRPPLSKAYLAGVSDVEDLLLLDADWYRDHDVEVRLGARATGLDPERRVVLLEDDEVGYDELVIATGSRPRRLPYGAGLAGVHELRSLADADRLRAAAATAERAVVIGGGFVGFEVASTLSDRGPAVTVLEAAVAPLARILDTRTASVLVEHARANGVTVRCGTGVADIVGDETDSVRAVVLADGTEIPADLVVVGIGAQPNVEWLEGSGLPVDAGGLHADDTGRVAPGVWAVGDVSAWRNADGAAERHEHWTHAGDQARAVAQNIAEGTDRIVAGVPYAWSDQFGLRINIVGEPHLADEVRHLSAAPGDLVALHAINGTFVGACIVGQPRLTAQSRAWAGQRKHVDEIPPWTDAAAAATSVIARSTA
ncbi:NAD(P)/FAD-dependent oxidoreductase [Nocardioides sp. GXZ039]|uniref:NAD(P)/FAD-dependent oxidoreductase n=1 Tax=Nocardioides sp. GXZ039 TaxID=3136018 RepID=UPI0030F419F1